MNHPSPRASARKNFAVISGEPAALGVDVHKRSYHVAMWSVERDVCLGSWVQPAEPQLLLRKLSALPLTIKHVVYEAGPTGFGLIRVLLEAGLPAQVISPGHTPTAPNEPKSDRRDARKLAKLAAKGQLHEIYIPTRQEELARTTKRHRDQCRKDHTCSQLRIKSFLLYHGLEEPAALKNWSKTGVAQLLQMCEQSSEPELAQTLKMMIQTYEQTRKMLADADTRIRHLAKRTNYKDAVAAIASIPGIGPRSAVQFLTEFGDPSRFDNRIEVARYLGLAPEVRSAASHAPTPASTGPANES